MIEVEFNSEDLPAADRFDRTRELLSQLPAPHDAIADHATAFRLHWRRLYLDGPRVWAMAGQPMTVRRTARLVRQSDPET